MPHSERLLNLGNCTLVDSWASQSVTRCAAAILLLSITLLARLPDASKTGAGSILQLCSHSRHIYQVKGASFDAK